MKKYCVSFTKKGVKYNIKDKEARDLIDRKQDLLVSGQNIKTINGQSILGSGDIDISQIVAEELRKLLQQ